MWFTIGSRPEKSSVPEGTNFWDEDDPHSRYKALTDACWIYRYREMEQNLRRCDWRRARRRKIRRRALSQDWVCRGRGDLRLTRRGLEMRFQSGVRVIGWKKLEEMIEARRS